MKHIIMMALLFSTLASANEVSLRDFSGTYDLLPTGLSRDCKKMIEIQEGCKGIQVKEGESFCNINKGSDTRTERNSGGHAIFPSLDRIKVKVELENNIITKTETTHSISIGIHKWRDIITLELEADILTRTAYASLIDRKGDLTDEVELNQQCIYRKRF